MYQPVKAARLRQRTCLHGSAITTGSGFVAAAIAAWAGYEGACSARVDPELHESYLAGCMSVVEKACRADGCLDLAITADLLDPGRVNLFERWESQAAVATFRRRGPRNKQSAATRSVSVAEYDIADVRPLLGKGRA